MDLPRLPSSAPRTPPGGSSQADSSMAPPLPYRIPLLPSRVARRSMDFQQGATRTENQPKLDLNLPEEKNQQSVSVPNSVASSPTDSVAGGKTKKRGRVNPKQLAQLEKLFVLDACPPVERRKEISIALGMQERQLQIWFQNRRAKEKNRQGIPPRPRQRRQRLSLSISPPPPQPITEPESLPNTPPELTPGFDSELNALINEDLPVDIIPCDTLTIGTWKRLRSEEEHSLVAYVSDSRQCLTWFVHKGGRSYKMIIPFHIIMHTELDDTSGTAAGTIEISFILSQPPLFFFEAKVVDPGTLVTNRAWQESLDWTEDGQGTYCLRHTIRGPAIALHRFLEKLQPRLASLDRKANLRRRPMSWHQSPSSASEYSCPTPQGSISPLEIRKRLLPAEVFEPYSQEASTQSSCPGPMGYYYRSRFADSGAFSDHPSPSSSEDQPSPTASGGDQPSPQATTPQYIDLDGSPVTEAFESSFVLTLPPIVPPIAGLHQDPSMAIPNYQHHTPPPPTSGLEPTNGCMTDQAFAVNAAVAFPEPSPQTGVSFSNSYAQIPVTTRYYTLDYGLATGCSNSTHSPQRSTRSSTLPSTLFTQPQYNELAAGSLGQDTSSYYFSTNTSTSANFVPSSNTSSTLLPPASFNRPDFDSSAIPSGLTATARMSSFYPEAPVATTATASMDPGLNPDLFQYLQQPVQHHQLPQQQQPHHQPTLIAPIPFSASTRRLQGDWIADLQQWEQERNQHRHQHQQHL